MKYRKALVLTVLLGLGLSLISLFAPPKVAYGEIMCIPRFHTWELELAKVVVGGKQQDDLSEYENLTFLIEGDEEQRTVYYLAIRERPDEPTKIERFWFNRRYF